MISYIHKKKDKTTYSILNEVALQTLKLSKLPTFEI